MKSSMKFAFVVLSLFLAVSVLSACSLRNQATPTTEQNPGLIYTAAAQTVAAQLTQAAVGTPVVFPSATAAQVQPSPTAQVVVVQPSATQIPTNTPVPPTPVPPTPTQVPVPCDRASFVKDVSYVDDSVIAPGTNFVKTWRLKNTGTCTWNSSYSLIFVSGDSMGAPASQQLTTATVAPGDSIDVSVNLVSPTTAKTYQGFFQLRNGSGVNFGIGLDAKSSFWVKVKVSTPPTPTFTATVQPTLTPTPSAALQYDLVAKGPDATWSTSSNPTLPWGDPSEDKLGMAVSANGEKMEDGYSYAKELVTLPVAVDSGYIRGVYPEYTVQAGDHFRTAIGLSANCSNIKYRYQLKYIESGTETLLGEWLKGCDRTLIFIDKDLSGLVGKAVNFVLIVSREPGNLTLNLTYWVFPRVEH